MNSDEQLLPSARSAIDFVNGEPDSGFTLLGHFLGRSAIISTGLYVFAGEREKVFRKGLAGAGAIELMVLGLAAHRKHKANAKKDWDGWIRNLEAMINS